MKINLVWLSIALFASGTGITATSWLANQSPSVVGQSASKNAKADSNSPQPAAMPPAGMRRVVETKTKLVNFTIIKPVYEKHQKEVSYTVMKPVYETKEKVVTYTVCTMIPETKTKTVEYTTCRMVPEAKQKSVEYQEVRFVPVNEPKVEAK